MLRNTLNNKQVHNLFLYGSSTGIAQAMMMVYALVLARHLGPDGYGIFIANYSLAGVSSFLINWGMDQWLLRQNSSTVDISAVAGRVLSNKARYGLVWQAGLVLIAPLVRSELFPISLVFFSALDIFFDSCLNTEFAMLNKQGRFRLISNGMILSRSLRLLSLFVLVMVGTKSVLAFSQARLAATLFTLLLVTWLARPKPGPQKFLLQVDLLRQSIPYAVSDFLTIIYFQSDTMVLSIMAGERAAGYYGPATGIISALFVIPNTFYFIFLPLLSDQAAHNRKLFIKTAKRMFLFLTLSGILLMAGIMFSSRLMIAAVLGSQYQVTGNVLLILSPILFFKSLGFGLAAFLVAVNWQTKRLLPQALAAVLNVLLNILVIPYFGAIGVAWVYVCSELVLIIGYSWLLLTWVRKPYIPPSVPPITDAVA